MPCYGNTYCYFCGVMCYLKPYNETSTKHVRKVYPDYFPENYEWTCHVVVLDSEDVWDAEEGEGLDGYVKVSYPYVSTRQEMIMGDKGGYKYFKSEWKHQYILHKRCYNILKQAATKTERDLFPILARAPIPDTEITKYVDYYPYHKRIFAGEDKDIVSADFKKFNIHSQDSVEQHFQKFIAGEEVWLYDDPKNPSSQKQRSRLLYIVNILFETTFVSL